MKPNYDPNVVNQTVDFGGQKWRGQPGQGWSNISNESSSGGQQGAVANPIDTAQQIRQFNIQANQPAVQTLQGQIDPLKQRYSSILNDIKGQQSVAEGYQTRATTSSLGARGLMPQSGEGQQALANAMQPLEQQFQTLSLQSNNEGAQRLMDLQNQIAGLQTGDPNAAISGALNVLGVQQGAQNVQTQTAAQIQAANIAAQAQLGAGSIASAADIQRAQIENQYKSIYPGGGLFNTSTNQLVAGVDPRTFKPGGIPTGNTGLTNAPSPNLVTPPKTTAMPKPATTTNSSYNPYVMTPTGPAYIPLSGKNTVSSANSGGYLPLQGNIPLNSGKANTFNIFGNSSGVVQNPYLRGY